MATIIEENYIKAVFKLALESGGVVSTSALASELDIQAASVTDMIKKLSAKKLIDYERYQGVQLTDKGRHLAIQIIRKHRIWEVFLFEKLGFDWSEVHAVAEQLEHVESEILIDRLDAFLGYPKKDPHGFPIPDKNGNMPAMDQQLLSSLKPGQQGLIAGVKDDSSHLLQFLDRQQLVLGVRFLVAEVFDFDDSVILEVGERRIPLSRKVADHLLVTVVS